MSWFHWALLSALFVGLTAVLAKAGIKGMDYLATAIRTVVILVFAWTEPIRWRREIEDGRLNLAGNIMASRLSVSRVRDLFRWVPGGNR